MLFLSLFPLVFPLIVTLKHQNIILRFTSILLFFLHALHSVDRLSASCCTVPMVTFPLVPLGFLLISRRHYYLSLFLLVLVLLARHSIDSLLSLSFFFFPVRLWSPRLIKTSKLTSPLLGDWKPFMDFLKPLRNPSLIPRVNTVWDVCYLSHFKKYRLTTIVCF